MRSTLLILLIAGTLTAPHISQAPTPELPALPEPQDAASIDGHNAPHQQGVHIHDAVLIGNDGLLTFSYDAPGHGFQFFTATHNRSTTATPILPGLPGNITNGILHTNASHGQGHVLIPDIQRGAHLVQVTAWSIDSAETWTSFLFFHYADGAITFGTDMASPNFRQGFSTGPVNASQGLLDPLAPLGLASCSGFFVHLNLNVTLTTADVVAATNSSGTTADWDWQEVPVSFVNVTALNDATGDVLASGYSNRDGEVSLFLPGDCSFDVRWVIRGSYCDEVRLPVDGGLLLYVEGVFDPEVDVEDRRRSHVMEIHVKVP